jgi:hypothetical protein
MTSEKKTLFIIVRSKAKGVNVQATSLKSRLHSPPPTNASSPSTNSSPLHDRAVSPFINASNVDHSITYENMNDGANRNANMPINTEVVHQIDTSVNIVTML